MKKKYNTLNEEMNRMKSLFGESMLYGNLIIEDTEPSPDKVKEVMEPIKTEVLEILSNWKIYNGRLKMRDGVIRFGGKSKIKSEIEKSEDIIDNMDSKDFCSDSTLSKIESNRKNLKEKEKENRDILTSKDKEFISSLKQKMNLLKSECQRLKSEIENNTEVVDNSEEETKVIEGCPPVGDDGCMVVTKEILEESMVDGVLDIYKLFGFNSEIEQKCGTPKMKIPEELLSSITEIKKLEYPSMFESDNGDIEFCNENFPNVTTIKKLVFDSDPFDIGRFLPNLKNVDDLFIDDFELYYDYETYSKLFSNLSVTNIFAVTEGTSHISFNSFKDETLVSKNVENIEVNLVKGFDDDDYFNYLIDFGWIEKEGEDGVTFLTNPKNKVQELPQVDVIGGKEGAEEEDDSDTDEKEVQSVGKPKMMVDDEEKDIIYTNTKMNKNYNIGKFVYDKKKKEFKIKSKFPFYGKRTGNLVKQMEDAFWETLSKWYDKPLNSDNTTLDIINDKKFKVKIK
tara:strand:+ start:198 stop:1727 length:1530 start_codon:yes stop_codon:yes gene_type:complete